MNEPTLLIGCGGSGIETLKRLNKILSEDPRSRHRVSSDVYFIVVDTEVAKINDYIHDYKTKFATDETGNIYPIRLSAGITSIYPILRDHFTDFSNDVEGDTARRRLYEHCWLAKEGELPFEFTMVRDVSEGASQCPPVSFLLAWNYLQTFAREFDEFLDNIIHRRGGIDAARPLNDMNVIVASSIAGGTGRGAWIPITFAIRAYLLQRGVDVSPHAFIFDGELYTGVLGDKPLQQVAAQVNSLTGISELSAWMKLPDTDESQLFEYRLPNFLSANEPQVDVLNTDRRGGGRKALRPVDSVFLIFPDGEGASRLASPEMGYDMAGTAIYTIMNTDQGGKLVNDHMVYRGLAAASYEIDTTGLSIYFEHLARIAYLKGLQQEDRKVVEEVADRFFTDSNLDIRMGLDQIKGDPRGNIVQQICHRLYERKADNIARTVGELNEDQESATERLGRIVITGQGSSQLKEAVREAFSALGVDLSANLRVSIENVYRSGRLDQGRSLANVRVLLARIRREITFTGKEGVIPPGQVSDAIRDMQSLGAFVKERADRKYTVVGERFEESERSEIIEEAKQWLFLNAYKPILQVLGSFLQENLAQYVKFEEQLHNLDRHIQRLIRAIEDELVSKLKSQNAAAGDSIENLHEGLFTDPNEPERSYRQMAKDPQRFLKRKLRPIVEKGQEMELLVSSNGVELNNPQVLDDLFLNYLGINGEPRQQIEQEFFWDMKTNIEHSVHLSRHFMEKKFAVVAVAGDLQKVWIERINNHLGSKQELYKLIELYKDWFGSDPEFIVDSYVTKPFSKFLIDMLIGLAIHAQPYIRFTADGIKDLRGTDQSYGVTIYLPPVSEFNTEAATRDIQEALRKITGNRGVHVSVEMDTRVAADLHSPGPNPFSMLFMSAEGAKDPGVIESLGYWKRNVKVFNSLKMAEQFPSPLIFEDGRGYSDPTYLTNERVRRLRWKPWQPEELDKKQRLRVYDALLYALLLPSEMILQQLEEKTEWHFPLISQGALRWFSWERFPYMKPNERLELDNSADWEPTDKVEQSIHKLLYFFEAPINSKVLDRVLAERELFMSEILMPHGLGKGTKSYEEMVSVYRRELERKAKKIDDQEQNSVWKALAKHTENWLQ